MVNKMLFLLLLLSSCWQLVVAAVQTATDDDDRLRVQISEDLSTENCTQTLTKLEVPMSQN